MAGKLRYLKLRNNRWYARVAVPKDVRAIIGKTGFERALGADRQQAERALHGVVGPWLAQIEDARRRLGRPARYAKPERSRKEAASPMTDDDLARKHYRYWVAVQEHAGDTDASLGISGACINSDYLNQMKRIAGGGAADTEIQRTLGWAIDEYRSEGLTSAEPASAAWRGLARKLARAEIETLRRVDEFGRGDFAGRPVDPLFALDTSAAVVTPTHGTAAPAKGEAVSIRGMLKGHLDELRLSGGGRGAEAPYGLAVDRLVEHIGSDDARKVTRPVVISWKEALLKTLSPKTARDKYLAPVKAVFGWGLNNARIDANPFSGVTVKVGKKIRGREKGLNDAEALAVLRAAASHVPKAADNPSNRESPELTAAKRWLPWLSAFTGARVGELAQLRKEDVRELDGIAHLRLTPDAGSIKTGEFRDVPLHPQLIERGFLTFVESRPDGPLFYRGDRTRRTGAKPWSTVSGRVSDWVQGLGVLGEGVQPTHGWRHRFKTIGREIGIDPRVLDAIQGHAPRTAGEGYGDVTLKAKKTAIDQFPRYGL